MCRHRRHRFINVYLIVRIHGERVVSTRRSPGHPVFRLRVKRLFPRIDPGIDIGVARTMPGYRMTRWSLCVVSTTVYGGWDWTLYGELNFPNFDRASSTARCNLYRPKPSPSSPIPFPARTHIPGGFPSFPLRVAAPPPPRATVISREVVHDDLGGSNIYIVRGGRRTCGEVVREVTMFPCNSSLLFS